MCKAIVLSETTSTNDYLKKISGDCESWTYVVSRKQTNGRGTKGRSFISREGGLYMSVLLRPDKSRLQTLTCMAAVAVKRAIKAVVSKDVGIKWINDLYFDGKKICGILTETITTDSEIRSVVGIGVNVFYPDGGFGEYERIAGALSCDKKDENVIETLAKSIVENMRTLYRLGRDEYMAEYSASMMFVGERVNLNIGGVTEEVTVLGVDDMGRLIAEKHSGEQLITDNGEIKCIART